MPWGQKCCVLALSNYCSRKRVLGARDRVTAGGMETGFLLVRRQSKMVVVDLYSPSNVEGALVLEGHGVNNIGDIKLAGIYNVISILRQA